MKRIKHRELDELIQEEDKVITNLVNAMQYTEQVYGGIIKTGDSHYSVFMGKKIMFEAINNKENILCLIHAMVGIVRMN